ncbi:HypC/HybG/HupF family hydrogenase formation chaperone [candidate division KSB1 bacterium]|nr:HypC/HybG/HupF family hydrogenase formation chaperone [candidate division KSB1 bacterium]
MCLGIPGKIVKIEASHQAVVEVVGNVQRMVNIRLTPEIQVGDWIVIHAGFAIQKLDADEAEATWSLFREYGINDAF